MHSLVVSVIMVVCVEIESTVQLGAWDHGGYMCFVMGGIHLSVLYSLNCVSCDQLMVFTVQVVGP